MSCASFYTCLILLIVQILATKKDWIDPHSPDGIINPRYSHLFKDDKKAPDEVPTDKIAASDEAASNEAASEATSLCNPKAITVENIEKIRDQLLNELELNTVTGNYEGKFFVNLAPEDYDFVKKFSPEQSDLSDRKQLESILSKMFTPLQDVTPLNWKEIVLHKLFTSSTLVWLFTFACLYMVERLFRQRHRISTIAVKMFTYLFIVDYAYRWQIRDSETITPMEVLVKQIGTFSEMFLDHSGRGFGKFTMQIIDQLPVYVKPFFYYILFFSFCIIVVLVAFITGTPFAFNIMNMFNINVGRSDNPININPTNSESGPKKAFKILERVATFITGRMKRNANDGPSEEHSEIQEVLPEDNSETNDQEQVKCDEEESEETEKGGDDKEGTNSAAPTTLKIEKSGEVTDSSDKPEENADKIDEIKEQTVDFGSTSGLLLTNLVEKPSFNDALNVLKDLF